MGIFCNKGLLIEFDYDQSREDVDLLLSEPPTLLGQLILNIDDEDNRVWLTGSILFRVISSEEGHFGEVIIAIYRDDPDFTTDPIFITADSGVNTGQVVHFNTSFSAVDENPPIGMVTYYITGRLAANDPGVNAMNARIRHFTGAEIKAN